MIVRIKFGRGPVPGNAQGKNRGLALALAALLVPASLMAYIVGFWRLTSDIGMTREFAIGGVFSHWQIWIAAAVVLHMAVYALNRYGRDGEFHLPRVLHVRFKDAAPPPKGPSSHEGAPRAKAS